MSIFAFLSRKPSASVLERLAELESSQERLELLMDDLKTMMKRLQMRMRHENLKTEDAPQEAVEGGTGASVPTVHGLLSPRQRDIQQQILRRRAGG